MTLPGRGPAAIIRAGDFEALRADSADTEHSYLRYGVAKSAAYGGRLSVPRDGCAADLHQRYRSPFTNRVGLTRVSWPLVTVEARMSSF